MLHSLVTPFDTAVPHKFVSERYTRIFHFPFDKKILRITFAIRRSVVLFMIRPHRHFPLPVLSHSAYPIVFSVPSHLRNKA